MTAGYTLRDLVEAVRFYLPDARPLEVRATLGRSIVVQQVVACIESDRRNQREGQREAERIAQANAPRPGR